MYMICKKERSMTFYESGFSKTFENVSLLKHGFFSSTVTYNWAKLLCLGLATRWQSSSYHTLSIASSDCSCFALSQYGESILLFIMLQILHNFSLAARWQLFGCYVLIFPLQTLLSLFCSKLVQFVFIFFCLISYLL